MKALTRAEVLAVMEAASDSPRNHAMLLLQFKHGMRASEVCGLKLSDVDIENGEITVRRLKGSLKTTQPLMDIPKQPLLSERKVLRDYLKVRPAGTDTLFVSRKGGQLDRTAYFRMFQQVAEKAGLPKSKRHDHTLKHSTATILLESGADIRVVKQTLGHKSLASTGVYLEMDDQRAGQLAGQAMRAAF